MHSVRLHLPHIRSYRNHTAPPQFIKWRPSTFSCFSIYFILILVRTIFHRLPSCRSSHLSIFLFLFTPSIVMYIICMQVSMPKLMPIEHKKKEQFHNVMLCRYCACGENFEEKMCVFIPVLSLHYQHSCDAEKKGSISI